MWISREKWDDLQGRVKFMESKIMKLEEHCFYYETNITPDMKYSNYWMITSVKEVLDLLLDKLGYKVSLLDKKASRVEIKVKEV